MELSVVVSLISLPHTALVLEIKFWSSEGTENALITCNISLSSYVHFYNSMIPDRSAYIPMCVFNPLGLNAYLCMCAWVCVCMYVCVHLSIISGIHVHGICVEVIGQPPVSVHIFHIVWYPVFYCCSPLQKPGLLTHTHLLSHRRKTEIYNHLSFYIDSGGLEWGPHARAASTLLWSKFPRYRYLISWRSIFSSSLTILFILFLTM